MLCVLLFLMFVGPVGCWNNFFLVFLFRKEPFGGVGEKKVHTMTRCTLLKVVFYSSMHVYLFFLLHHQSFNKKK